MILISVALVTRNRPESLEQCLKSWRLQTVSPLEIIISDDSNEVYAPKVEELAKKFDCVYTKGPQRGLYANRNHASLTCRGTHILSADDDHTHPQDYVERILEVVATNPRCIWIFTERHPSRPHEQLVCPAEITPSGRCCTPKDPSNCAAIADGSSVYPRQVFEQGLHYDDTYPFGGMWYLWGRELVKHGWRISFSDATFIWHHCVGAEREFDPKWLQSQIECNFYASFVNCLWLQPSIKGIARGMLHLLHSIIISSSKYGGKVKVRLEVTNVWRLLIRAFRSKSKYLKTSFLE